MTNSERFIRTLKCERIGGRVPTFELVFFLTMEAFGRVHPSQRHYGQWNQMSGNEKSLHIEDMADLYIQTAKRYGHSAIFIHPNPDDLESTQWLLETIREKSGDEYFIMMHGDPTLGIPSGDNMMEFAVNMYEAPEKLYEVSKRDLEHFVTWRRSCTTEAICWTVSRFAPITASMSIPFLPASSLMSSSPRI